MSVPGNLYTPTIRKTRGGGYVIEGSGLFDGSTGFLSKTYGAAATNAQTGALEFVLAKTTLVNNATTGAMTLFAAGSSTGGSSMVVIYDSGGWFGSSNDSLVIGDRGGAWYYIFDNILFRDVAAFGQVTIEYDTTLVSGSDRFIVKYNGTRLTASSEVAVTQNTSMDISTNAKSVFIGRQGLDATRFMPMYLARATNIDGSIPADGSFGEFTTDGYWQINDVSGMTFGTNGWLLEGGDNVAAGTDSSGNGNDFTKTGTITATNNSPTDDAANDVGNYATLNPNDKSSNLNLSEGNLTYEYDTRPASEIVKATIYFLYTGKFYWEQENLQTSGQPGRIWGGIHNRDTSLNVSSTNTGVISYTYDGQIKDEASSLGTAASWYTGERSAYAVDCATGEIWIGKVTSGGSTTWYDNTATGGADPAAGTSATASVTNITDWAPCGGWTEGGYSVQSFSSTLNFGQSAFLGTAPTGFKPLCTAHLPAPAIPDPSAHFQADTLVGNATDDTDFTFGGNSDLAADMLWLRTGM